MHQSLKKARSGQFNSWDNVSLLVAQLKEERSWLTPRGCQVPLDYSAEIRDRCSSGTVIAGSLSTRIDAYLKALARECGGSLQLG